MKAIQLFYLTLLLMPLAGCPHILVQQIQELQPPKNYKPIYQTSEILVDSVLKSIPFNQEIASSLHELTREQDITQSIDSIFIPKDSLQNTIECSILGIKDQWYPDSILMKVSVKDQKGHFIKGLADKKDVWKCIVDSCSSPLQQSIQEFTVREVQESKRMPLAISFVLDHSPSMGDMRARKLQEAVRTTMDLVNEEDAVSVIKFSGIIHNEVPLTNDYKTYTSRLNIDGLRGNKKGPVILISFSGKNDSTRIDTSQTYGMGTALYDATLAGIQELQHSSMNSIIVLFSDGGDNSSKAQADSVIRMARKNNIAIYSIAYGLTDIQPLQELSQNTGGKVYRIYSTKEFPFVLADIFKSMKNHYVISYKPSPCAGKHKAGVYVQLRADIAAYDVAYYDKSLFTSFDEIGKLHSANIEFERGKSDIVPGSEQVLHDIAQAMIASPQLVLQIIGHTDDIGNEEDNQRLSYSRAQSVARAIQDRGIPYSRLQILGKGESSPLIPNINEESRKKNRRTEFILQSR